ncbi:RdgB/HAM1 family non-canonical purine NTP pyrophosphatase [Sphingosinicella sp. LHD-64]|uniref:RdgB/HAM1 family non-canonical purine NTP pyrophosphatase n=1 Tax=Sphingosinicella sp. LHD-64 TaxID=3072139 RepID=UPI00280FA976|nr:RdgB/HAM1 family non-canonical purine NTP pyrophosphatase [Sphingosinicella sp. LHD-64]MDQ8756432.1 RdgB/HAM1 family non-canonical purine NTP pyrophosphatase [Sphingosinicella sp. LHD-64]
MTHKLLPGKLVIASHNEGKVREIRELLGPYGIEPVSAAELDLPEPDETGVTFIDNADLKARQAADLSGLPALADDSGLCVEALGDRPGIFSARWAVVDAHVDPAADPGEVQGGRDFGFAMRRVHDELEALGDDASRNAHFVCALALCWPDGHSEWFEGRVDGTIAWPPRGDNGFGYDPIFVPAGHDITFGEMDPAEKHAMSHRADAFRKLVVALL